MRRFLVVGCGGSGGATLAYMMDQLRSDLVPLRCRRDYRGRGSSSTSTFRTPPNRGPSGLGNVEQQGGAYVGCGPAAAAYNVLDRR